MKKTTVWALALALAGLTMVSCDNSSSPPPADTDTTDTGNNTGGGGTTTITPDIELLAPADGDSIVSNDVTNLTLRFKTAPKTGVTAKVNGTSVTGSSSGEFPFIAKNLPVGISLFEIVATGTTSDTNTIKITRQLGAPIIKGLGGAADQIDFTDSVRVQITVADDALTDSVRFTTNGATAKISTSDPLVASGYTKTIKGTTTFRAISMRRNAAGVVYSDTTTVTFIIGKTLSKPYYSTNRVDSFNYESKIGIGGFGANDTVRYTTDGGDPTRDSRIYSKTDSILVQDSSTIIAKSFNGANQSSAPCTTSIKLKALPPIFSVKSGVYTSQRLLSIRSLSNVPVYYTTDGTDPTSQSLKAGDSLYIDSNVTIKAMAFRPGWRASKIDSAKYTFKVATPKLSFRTGNYDTTQILSITDSAFGAKIYFTLDGTTPTCASTLYDADSALKLDSNVTIKSIACKDGWEASALAVGSYTFKVAKINFAPDSAVYRNYQSVKLSTRSPGVTFFVTRDSTPPTWDATLTPQGSTQKKLPGDTLWITKSQWLRVVAARTGWANSTDDARRYIIEGDTLLVEDFEQNSLTRPIGYDWRFWACGYCVSTGVTNQMEVNAADTIRQIGFRHGKIDFQIPDFGSVQSADGFTGSGYAGYSVGVPSNAMNETYRMVFWARWKKVPSAPDSVPLVTELVWNNNDKQNGSYKDGFHRLIEWVGPEWRRYVLDYSAFYPATNAYMPTSLKDSTSTTPKSYWILAGFPDSAKMISMGLSKFQGEIYHQATWTPSWVWGADHDLWNKGNITNLRWSVMQPYTNKAGLAALSHREWMIQGVKDTAIDTTVTDSLGTRDTSVVVTIPRWVYCGDCHQPAEPGIPDSILTTLVKNLSGSLELDRIQLIRRPQQSGGSVETVAKKEDPVVPPAAP